MERIDYGHRLVWDWEQREWVWHSEHEIARFPSLGDTPLGGGWFGTA